MASISRTPVSTAIRLNAIVDNTAQSIQKAASACPRAIRMETRTTPASTARPISAVIKSAEQNGRCGAGYSVYHDDVNSRSVSSAAVRAISRKLPIASLFHTWVRTLFSSLP